MALARAWQGAIGQGQSARRPPLPSLALLTGLVAFSSTTGAEPIITLTGDNTRISESCVIRIAPGLTIDDDDGNGVLHIVADGVRVTFEEGSVLRSSRLDEKATGIGIRIDGHRNVTVQGATVQGYKVGLYATRCPSLLIDSFRGEHNFRQRLRSTLAAEDQADWLWPHDNDKGEWRERYGAAVYLERCQDATVRRLVVRAGQNGLILDRVTRARIYDNDCSFLSGWGIALWRSSNNIISRNACDFCIRGHSDGVYNRGQDSAGFLVFEQSNNNIFIENSATHSGNGFFGFAGKESLGERAPLEGRFDPAWTGCNDNLLLDNDFSWSSAHGIEMTFSRRNRFIHNRLVGNGICGIWAGYSHHTIIADNYFENNGLRTTGGEGGAINIEHGSANRIDDNTFLNNKVGVSLWWDDDATLLLLPGVAAHAANTSPNIISNNRFEQKPPSQSGTAQEPIQLSDRSPPPTPLPERPRLADTQLHNNIFVPADAPTTRRSPDSGPLTPRIIQDGPLPTLYPTPREPLGESAPVGSRAKLAGTQSIVIGPLGPWDHASPLILPLNTSSTNRDFIIFGALPDEVSVVSSHPYTKVATAPGLRTRVTLQPGPEGSVLPYSLTITAQPATASFTGLLMNQIWHCAAFPWTIDPREDDQRWRNDRVKIPQAVISTSRVAFMFGSGGPADLPIFSTVKELCPGPDRFGMVCVTSLTLPPGLWKCSIRSDDGVRVVARYQRDDKLITTTLIENWTHHAPTTDTAVLRLDQETEVNFQVEYFELDGNAELAFNITHEPLPAALAPQPPAP